MTLDPALISNSLLFLSGFSIVFLVVLWVSLIIWTFRDIRLRTKDRLLRILAILVSTVLFIPGVFIYVLLRPQKTLDEAYQNSLEEEALLQTLEEFSTCPGCGRQIVDTWIVCPDCHSRLRKKCPKCGNSLILSWEICPFCEEIQPGYHQDESRSETMMPISHTLSDPESPANE
jgi:predicted membrane channel-forming protein YqfA (hemolysin III family)